MIIIANNHFGDNNINCNNIVYNDSGNNNINCINIISNNNDNNDNDINYNV